MLPVTCCSSNDTTKVIIVDDHPIVRQGIAQLINREKDIQVCLEAGTAREALEILRKCSETPGCIPDIAIVDMSLPGVSGIDLTKSLNTSYPGLRVLMVSMHDEFLYAERALKAGARGYVMKQEEPTILLGAIRKIMNDEIYLSDGMYSEMLQRTFRGAPGTPMSPVSFLSDKELEVLQLMGKGNRTADIARELHRSIKTIEAHRAHLKEKLHMKNSAELVRFAVQWVESEQQS